jgi:hypothetical protein
MGHILTFSDPDSETLELMSWLITGRLEPEQEVWVETHLVACADCRRHVAEERELIGAVVQLPFKNESGWSAMRNRIDAAGRQGVHRLAPAHDSFPSRQVGIFRAAHPALLVAAVPTSMRATAPVAPYHAWSSAQAAAIGDAVIIFRPDTRESDIRGLLRDSDARLVDGPTAANAYVVRIPVTERARALARLRRDAAVALAEPLDGAALR